MDHKTIKISDIIRVENSFITLLAKYKNEVNKFGIFYFNHKTRKPIQIFNNSFALLYKELISNFYIGYTTGAIVGLARERTPEDQWYSDTIERNVQDKNSIHQGILRIINKEDGIPVFIHSTQTVGNIAPALAYLQRGNPVEIHKALKKYDLVQKNIMERILEGKPSEELVRPVAPFYCLAQGCKSENRRRTISNRLESLTLSEEEY